MKEFTYSYRDETHVALVEKFSELGYDRFQVSLKNGYVVIARFGMTGPGEKTIWLQAMTPGEISQPHDLIQAMGEGMEKELVER